jgi:hypothetical protein
MKTFTIIAIISLFATISFSQNSNSIDLAFLDLKQKVERNTEWQVYSQTDQLIIEYKFENCNPRIGYDKESVILRFTNRNKFDIELNWHMLLFYDGVCKTCEFPEEYDFTLNLTSFETIEGSCDLNSDYKTKIFSKFNDVNYTKGAVLTGFQFANYSETY